jgi:hypothetical protein
MVGILLESWRLLSGAILLRAGGSAEHVAAGLMLGSVVVGKTRGETMWAVLGLAGCCGGTWCLISTITGQIKSWRIDSGRSLVGAAFGPGIGGASLLPGDLELAEISFLAGAGIKLAWWNCLLGGVIGRLKSRSQYRGAYEEARVQD